MKKIKDLPANEQPREKLFEKGAEVVANHGLVPLFLSKSHRKMEEAHNTYEPFRVNRQ